MKVNHSNTYEKTYLVVCATHRMFPPACGGGGPGPGREKSGPDRNMDLEHSRPKRWGTSRFNSHFEVGG